MAETEDTADAVAISAVWRARGAARCGTGGSSGSGLRGWQQQRIGVGWEATVGFWVLGFDGFNRF